MNDTFILFRTSLRTSWYRHVFKIIIIGLMLHQHEEFAFYDQWKVEFIFLDSEFVKYKCKNYACRGPVFHFSHG